MLHKKIQLFLKRKIRVYLILIKYTIGMLLDIKKI